MYGSFVFTSIFNNDALAFNYSSSGVLLTEKQEFNLSSMNLSNMLTVTNWLVVMS